MKKIDYRTLGLDAFWDKKVMIIEVFGKTTSVLSTLDQIYNIRMIIQNAIREHKGD